MKQTIKFISLMIINIINCAILVADILAHCSLPVLSVLAYLGARILPTSPARLAFRLSAWAEHCDIQLTRYMLPTI